MFTTPISMSLDTYNEVKAVWENLFKDTVKVDYNIHGDARLDMLVADVTLKAHDPMTLNVAVKILKAYAKLCHLDIYGAH
jgi:hypothetical protein